MKAEVKKLRFPHTRQLEEVRVSQAQSRCGHTPAGCPRPRGPRKSLHWSVEGLTPTLRSPQQEAHLSGTPGTTGAVRTRLDLQTLQRRSRNQPKASAVSCRLLPCSSLELQEVTPDLCSALNLLLSLTVTNCIIDQKRKCSCSDATLRKLISHCS